MGELGVIVEMEHSVRRRNSDQCTRKLVQGLDEWRLNSRHRPAQLGTVHQKVDTD